MSEQSLLEKLRELEQEKGESLAFKVVFQRALIEAFWHFQKLDSSVTDADPDSVEELLRRTILRIRPMKTRVGRS